MHTLTLVVPCYNEEKTLREIVERILKIRTPEIALEIIIVDDCSKDGSRAVAEQLCREYPELKLVCHQVNQGKGAALRSGFQVATGDFVGIQDADMEYNPEDYHIMLEPLLTDKADMVFGSRYLRTDIRRVLYFWHTWMNKFLTHCSNMFTNLDITDMETCYKLFRRELILRIAPRLKENRFGFEPEITAYIAEEKCRVYECAIRYNPRTYEEGKKIGWKDGLRALYCIFHYGACNAPVPMQLIIYFFIGASAALTNLIFFAIAIAAGLEFWISVLGAYVLAAAVNYLLCILILFRHKAYWNSFLELVVYALVFTAMGALDFGLTLGLISVGVNMMFGKLIASAVGFAGNYLLRKFLVFPIRKKRAHANA